MLTGNLHDPQKNFRSVCLDESYGKNIAFPAYATDALRPGFACLSVAASGAGAGRYPADWLALAIHIAESALAALILRAAAFGPQKHGIVFANLWADDSGLSGAS